MFEGIREITNKQTKMPLCEFDARSIAVLDLAPAGVTIERPRSTHRWPHSMQGYLMRGDPYTPFAEDRQTRSVYLDIVCKPRETTAFFGLPLQKRCELFEQTSLFHARALVKMWATFYELGRRLGQKYRVVRVTLNRMHWDRDADPGAGLVTPDLMANGRALFTDGTVPDWMDFLPVFYTTADDLFAVLPPAVYRPLPYMAVVGHHCLSRVGYRYLKTISRQAWKMHGFESCVASMTAFIFMVEQVNALFEAGGRAGPFPPELLRLFWKMCIRLL